MTILSQPHNVRDVSILVESAAVQIVSCVINTVGESDSNTRTIGPRAGDGTDSDREEDGCL